MVAGVIIIIVGLLVGSIKFLRKHLQRQIEEGEQLIIKYICILLLQASLYMTIAIVLDHREVFAKIIISFA